MTDISNDLLSVRNRMEQFVEQNEKALKEYGELLSNIYAGLSHKHEEGASKTNNKRAKTNDHGMALEEDADDEYLPELEEISERAPNTKKTSKKGRKNPKGK
jgi:hypothetical protein